MPKLFATRLPPKVWLTLAIVLGSGALALALLLLGVAIYALAAQPS